MNGWKTTKEDIQKLMSSLGSCGYVVYYHDKFGDLGIIGVVTGKLITDEKGKICLSLANFSLSCRAFNRRIEYGILKVLFSMVDTLHFNVVPTEKNTPLMQFYSSIGGTPFFSVEKYTSPKTYFMIILRGPTTIK
jgi:predicted enzyme involved in methoxymalonyl-ACP biosynthesis